MRKFWLGATKNSLSITQYCHSLAGDRFLDSRQGQSRFLEQRVPHRCGLSCLLLDLLWKRSIGDNGAQAEVMPLPVYISGNGRSISSLRSLIHTYIQWWIVPLYYRALLPSTQVASGVSNVLVYTSIPEHSAYLRFIIGKPNFASSTLLWIEVGPRGYYFSF